MTYNLQEMGQNSYGQKTGWGEKGSTALKAKQKEKEKNVAH